MIQPIIQVSKKGVSLKWCQLKLLINFMYFSYTDCQLSVGSRVKHEQERTYDKL